MLKSNVRRSRSAPTSKQNSPAEDTPFVADDESNDINRNSSYDNGDDEDCSEDDEESVSQGEETLDDHALLLLLERENASLRRNPKSILVEQGNLMTHLSTMQTLSEYHLKLSASSEMEEEDVAFWESIIEDHVANRTGGGGNLNRIGGGVYSGGCGNGRGGAIAQKMKIPNLLVVKIRSGIPPRLRSRIWRLMSDAQPELLDGVYQSLLLEDSPVDRIIKRDIPRTFPKLDM